jgi:hypothetical protein
MGGGNHCVLCNLLAPLMTQAEAKNKSLLAQ